MKTTGATTKTTQKLNDILNNALAQGYSFALWRKPAELSSQLLLSKNTRLIDQFSFEKSEPGFLFAPFSKTRQKIFIPGDYLFAIINGSEVEGDIPEQFLKHIPSKKRNLDYHLSKKSVNTVETTESHQTDYRQLVSDCLHFVKEGRFEKIVPTRVKEISIDEKTDLLELFNLLLTHYPNAFISLVSTPFSGTWIGATPEPLISIDKEQKFRTVALAGTQAFNQDIPIEQVSWKQKEIEEQALVERYIINCFKKIRLREFDEVGPRTFRAGNLLHLRSDFTVDLNEVNYPDLATVMLNLMHPTSAVCGMPMEHAYQYLRKREGYDREFYSGYLGPVNLSGESYLFVNLRCMKWDGEKAYLFAGAGVTSHSDPDLEFKESELKMETIYRLIRK